MIEGGTVEVGGARLRVRVVEATASERAPRTVVVLHGGPGLGHDYLVPTLTALLPEHRLLFYDQRGSGRSSGAEDPERLTMSVCVDDLEAVRRAAGLERITLLGHSFGALVAMHYAIAHSDRTEALLLMDPDPARHPIEEPPSVTIPARDRPEDREAMAAIRSREGWQEDPEAMTRFLELRFRSYLVRPEDAARIDFALDADVCRNFAVTGPKMRASLGNFDLTEKLRHVPCPTLVVAGAESFFPRAEMERISTAFPRGELSVIEGAAHFPDLEAPEATRRAVEAFVSRLSERSEPPRGPRT